MKVAILGRGVSGEAAAELARKLGYETEFFNDGPGVKLPGGFDLIVTSPGVKPLVSPLYAEALRSGTEFIGEMEFGFRHYPGKVIAVTGTNGKTTTTELTAFLLNALGIKTAAAGNIGLPLSAVAAREPETPVAVVEVSSFQLERVRDFAPAAAVLLNLESDHEDRYAGGFEEYCSVKKRIFDRVPEENRIWGLSFADKKHRVYYEGDTLFADGKSLLDLRETKLNAIHNRENLCAALELVLRVCPEKFFSPALLEAIKRFEPGVHRIQLFWERDGVRYYDDSKGTNPAAVAAALRTVPGQVVLVAGGLDKGMDFSPLREFAPRLRALILIGECRSKVGAAFAGTSVPAIDCGTDFALAVQRAVKAAKPGDAVMLSPACASMDMFKSYIDRGEQFQKLCREISIKNK